MQIINRCIFFLSLILLLGSPAIAVQKGIVNVPEADVYQDENFDSEVIDNLKSGETYQVSDKVYGQFYKIKLKSGKIGYIADYELKINGKEFQDEPFKEGLEEIKPPLKKSPLRKKSKAKAQADPQFDEDSEDESFFKEHFSGVTLQLINLHEETMGSVQVDNLYAIGFKSMDLT